MSENILVRRAKERMRLITPDTAAKVLTHDRYWTVPFLELYLERCNQLTFEDPKAGCQLSAYAPDLAERIRIGIVEEGEYSTEAHRKSAFVYAWAVRGTCSRSVSPVDAEFAFRKAFEVLDETCERGSQGELYRRFSAYLLYQNRLPEAGTWADEAIGIYRTEGLAPGLANGLVLRSVICNARNQSGIEDLSEALRCVDTETQSGQRTLIAALNTIGFEVAYGRVHRSHADLAFEAIDRCSRLIRSRRSLAKLKLLWTEGLLYCLVGVDRLAQRRLERARRGFLEVESLQDFALVSLDLVALLMEWKEKTAAAELVRETERHLSDFEENDLLRIFAPWRQKLPRPRELRVEQRRLVARPVWPHLERERRHRRDQ